MHTHFIVLHCISIMSQYRYMTSATVTRRRVPKFQKLTNWPRNNDFSSINLPDRRKTLATIKRIQCTRSQNSQPQMNTAHFPRIDAKFA